MALRYLNDVGEKFVRTDRKEMVQGITKACGRVVVGETITYRQNLIDGVSNVELLKGCGCDMVLINHYDMDMPMMPGLASSKEGIEKFFFLVERVRQQGGSAGSISGRGGISGLFSGESGIRKDTCGCETAGGDSGRNCTAVYGR